MQRTPLAGLFARSPWPIMLARRKAKLEMSPRFKDRKTCTLAPRKGKESIQITQ